MLHLFHGYGEEMLAERRTKERLAQLLPLCGHKGGLKQSLSVIFSSSSELGERGVSSEETSGDEQTNDKNDDEFSGQQLTKLFTDFDFLDDELDKDIEIGSFGWTSTTELANEEFTENDGRISPCGSESDHVVSTGKEDEVSADEEETDSLQRSHPESSLASAKYDDVDAVDSPPNLPRDPVEGERAPTPRPITPVSEPTTPKKRSSTPSSPIAVPKATHNNHLSSEVVASSPISQSSFDSNSGMESIPCTITTFHQTSDFAVLSYDEIPDRWSKLMSSFVSQPTVEEAIDSLPCFPLVLKSWSLWLLRITRETSQLMMGEPLVEIMNRLSTLEDILENELRLPYIFIDKEVFSTEKLLLKHRLTVLKLNVGLQGLQEKREQAQETIELIQTTKTDFSSDDELHELFGENKEKANEQSTIELCTCLYRLHMQFVMCLEIYLGYVEKIIKTVHSSAQITDVTVDLVSIRSELAASQSANVAIEDSSPGPIMTFKETADLVSDAVANRHFDEAISILRCYRQRHPSLSTCDVRADEEIETILSVYARSILKTRSGVFALLGKYEELSFICDKLSEVLADLLSSTYEYTKVKKNEEKSKSRSNENAEIKMSNDTSPGSE